MKKVEKFSIMAGLAATAVVVWSLLQREDKEDRESTTVVHTKKFGSIAVRLRELEKSGNPESGTVTRVLAPASGSWRLPTKLMPEDLHHGRKQWLEAMRKLLKMEKER